MKLNTMSPNLGATKIRKRVGRGVGSGTGKTSMVFEPMIARDIEKKYFFKEVSK